MRRAMVWGAAVCILLLCSAAWAAEKSAGEPSRNRQVQRDRPQNVSPEERAKLREKWAAMSDEERAQARAKARDQAAGNRPGAGAVPRGAAEQVATLKQEHQAVMAELQKIRQLAAKEKATETAKALDGLIARRQAEFQKRISQMEQRLQRVQAAQKEGGSTAPKTDTRQPAEATRQKNPGRQRQK